MASIFSLDFLNWLERNVPREYERLTFLFVLESEAWARIMSPNCHPEITREEFRNDIHQFQLFQVEIYQRYIRAYTNDLLLLSGISTHNIWKPNGHH